jgi:broad specificity phosphatase PhoE
MGKGIKDEARAQGLEPVSLSELIHQHVRAAIETAVHEELRAALRTSPYARNADTARPASRGLRAHVEERRPVAAIPEKAATASLPSFASQTQEKRYELI